MQRRISDREMRMGKKELKKIIEKCIASGEFHIAYDDAAAKSVRTTLASLCRQLSVLTGDELPFYYSKTGKEILITDHVTFNSGKKLTKQVDNFLDMFSSKRDLVRQQTKLSGRFKMLPPISKGPSTARNYLANCAVSFGEHYNRLEEYKMMLQEKGIVRQGGRIKTCFFIEDVTPLGSYIVQADGMHELVLLYVKQFLDLFERSRELDHVFFGCFMGCSDSLWYMGRNEIKYYRKKEMDLMRKKYFAFDVGKYEA
jgi:hypothetical protein